MFTVLAAVAEFEHNLISERTLDGLEAARARGRKGGRPSKITPGQARDRAHAARQRRAHAQEIADIVGVGRSTLYRALGAKSEATA